MHKNEMDTAITFFFIWIFGDKKKKKNMTDPKEQSCIRLFKSALFFKSLEDTHYTWVEMV